jgi:hypothetical protein
MAITLEDIDEKIRRLQELRRIVSDPSMASLLNDLIASKNGGCPAAIPQSEYKAKEGSLLAKIEETCRSFGSEPFTIRQIVQRFESQGNVFEAKDKAVSAFSAVKSLVKKGIVKQIKQGYGSQPSYFQMT